MKFSALREDLLSAVQIVQYSANAKGMMPILSGIRIESAQEGLVLHSTDLESYTITRCSANVEKEGECVVNLKILMDYLRDARDEKVEVEIVGNEMLLRGEKALFKLFTMPAEDFPNAPVVETKVLEEVENKVLMPAIQKVSRAASRDEKRPTLLGMLLEIEREEVRMVSTDSYRLAIRKIREGFRAQEEGKYIIPASAMANLVRIAGKEEKMDVYRDENKGQVRFDVGGSSHIIRLIEGKFPKYGQFIPESIENLVEVEKEALLGALKRASLISSTVKIIISGDSITVESESRDVGEGKEEISASYNGEDMEIAFNSRFLEDGIMSIDGDKMVMSITESLKPGIIKEKEGEEFMYIIMPIRL
ncbi:MAG: DNA polymerase III subunit beta [Actinobacteria bacterium]|nr:DNA polymerase III subunit beta [Actinomycetota bacterium]